MSEEIEEVSGEIEVTISCSNVDGETMLLDDANVAMEDLAAFHCAMGGGPVRPAVYAFVYDDTLTDLDIRDRWTLNGVVTKPVGITIPVQEDDVTDEEFVAGTGDCITVTITAAVVNVTDPTRRTADMYDAVVDGVRYCGIPSRWGYVESEDDLDTYAGERPGFLAIEYGMAHMWQLGADGEWVAVGAADKGGGGDS